MPGAPGVDVAGVPISVAEFTWIQIALIICFSIRCGGQKYRHRSIVQMANNCGVCLSVLCMLMTMKAEHLHHVPKFFCCTTQGKPCDVKSAKEASFALCDSEIYEAASHLL